MALLKTNIQELEQALSREREFNSSDTRINAEYLVNVLKKFLLTDNKSERSRLAIAITQILHMHPEECGKIADKWAPQLVQGRGLVGWLLPMTKKPNVVRNISVVNQSSSKAFTGTIIDGGVADYSSSDIVSSKSTQGEIDYLTDFEKYR